MRGPERARPSGPLPAAKRGRGARDERGEPGEDSLVRGKVLVGASLGAPTPGASR